MTEFFQETVGLPVVVVFAVITQLGDVWFLFLLGAAVYVTGDEFPLWGIERRRGLFVLTLLLTYVGLIGVLKNIFLLPRPPGIAPPAGLQGLPPLLAAVFEDFTTANGPGFPSGHALGTTMVWGGLALVLERWSVRNRLAAVSVVVVLVSIARLILGVHYAVDVIVGAGLGIIALGALYLLADRGTDPGRVFVVAVAIGVIGIFQGITFDSVSALGGAVGGWVVWSQIAEHTPAHPANRREVLAGFVVMGLAGVLFGIVTVVDPSYLLSFVGTALAVGGVVGAPLLGERLA